MVKVSARGKNAFSVRRYTDDVGGIKKFGTENYV